MNRREFIKFLGLVSASGLLNNPAFANSGNKKSKILIIGAGMAGIAAGKILHDNGHEVLILEAQDRPGGRIRSEKVFGTTLDFGASWIHGSAGNPLTKIAKEHNIETINTNYVNTQAWRSDGTPLTDMQLLKYTQQTNRLIRKANKFSNRQDKDVSMQTGIDIELQKQNLNKDELDAINWYLTDMEMNEACDFDQLSTWYGSDRNFSGVDKLFPGGYKQVIEVLSKNLSIKTGQHVREIKHDKKITIATDKEEFEADYCIVTVPLGVLKKGTIKFSPPLPPNKQHAIDKELEMGLLNKVALEFPKVFWPKERDFIGHISNTKGEFPIFINWAHYTNQPVLIGFLVGRYAREFEQLSDQEVMKKAHKTLSGIFKNAEPPTAVMRSKWASNPYAWGSYSYIPVGGGNNGSKNLAEPVGNLLFAGEATNHQYPATVHGAYLSGLREAKRILSE